MAALPLRLSNPFEPGLPALKTSASSSRDGIWESGTGDAAAAAAAGVTLTGGDRGAGVARGFWGTGVEDAGEAVVVGGCGEGGSSRGAAGGRLVLLGGPYLGLPCQPACKHT
ncbi:MAG: hypothetical protein FRX49_00885 [Trebouxia sp. A1-2]|nr:MAG: hypothetical protein FRX49_00885 [Trebouxia sp. A1-2]